MEVLRRVPDSAFDDLSNKANTFEWFIPEDYEFAGVIPFGNSRVLYLGHVLETWRSSKALISAVAHELAHIALKHGMQEADDAKHDIEEKDAVKLTKEWGFEKEERVFQSTTWGRRIRQNRQFAQIDSELSDRTKEQTDMQGPGGT